MLILFTWFRGCEPDTLAEKLIILQLPLIGSRRDLLRAVHKASHFMWLLPLSTSFPFTCRLLWKMKPLIFVQAFVSKCSVNFLFIPLSFHSNSLITFCIFRKRKQESYSICSSILKCYNIISTNKWNHFKEIGICWCKENLHDVSSVILISWVDMHLSL